MMEPIVAITLVIFLVTIGLIIWGKWDRTVVGIIGVVLMVMVGTMAETEAFGFVDWNIIAILFSIWIIAAYFSDTGVPQFLAITILRRSGKNVGIFLFWLGILAGFISMLIDNVVIILMMAPVIFHVTKKLKLNSFPFLITVGLAANFMGTALLLGDLPPQMFHSVTGIEFNEFIWQMGRPSSFPLLTATFLATMFFMYRYKLRKLFPPMDAAVIDEICQEEPCEYLKKKSFVIISLGLFLATILAMSFREVIGYNLGFIALTGMSLLVIINEIFARHLGGPSFDDILREIDWKALFFYIVLFVLVGAIHHVGIIKMIADALAPYFQQNLILGSSLLYWVTAPIVGIVEHDAYILVFLYLIRDLAPSLGISPWPLGWALLWAGTLGSNLTIAGAPALFVAQGLAEREGGSKVRLREFFSYSVPFVVFSLVVQYILTLIFWIIPFAF